MTRRQSRPDEPGRRFRSFHLPHLHRPRLPRWQQLVLGGLILAVGVFLSLRHPEALRSTVELLAPTIHAPGETIIADRPAEEAVLERRRQGLMTLVQSAARGPLVSRDANRVLFLVDRRAFLEFRRNRAHERTASAHRARARARARRVRGMGGPARAPG